MGNPHQIRLKYHFYLLYHSQPLFTNILAICNSRQVVSELIKIKKVLTYLKSRSWAAPTFTQLQRLQENLYHQLSSLQFHLYWLVHLHLLLRWQETFHLLHSRQVHIPFKCSSAEQFISTSLSVLLLPVVALKGQGPVPSLVHRNRNISTIRSEHYTKMLCNMIIS